MAKEAVFTDPGKRIAARFKVTTADGLKLDLFGFHSMKIRLQVGAADELTMELSSKDKDGKWRCDIPLWQCGATFKVEAGYDNDFKVIQTFEVVSTTNSYPDGPGVETVTVRGVSDLARAARSKKPRSFDYAPRAYTGPVAGADKAIIDTICSEFGWKNGVTEQLADPPKRVKLNGKPDLELLKLIAIEALIGGPRLTEDNVLIMPKPIIGTEKFSRGMPKSGTGWGHLRGLSANREGGQIVTRVAVVGWDPVAGDWIETEFEADEFGGDPRVVYSGKKAYKELPNPSTTQGLTLSVIEHRGTGKKERVDVLSTGEYRDTYTAEGLARRWFILREKLGRWADIRVDGNHLLKPFESVELGGNIASADQGVWVPITVEHTLDRGGWSTNLRCLRAVEDAVTKIVPKNDTSLGVSSSVEEEEG